MFMESQIIVKKTPQLSWPVIKRPMIKSLGLHKYVYTTEKVYESEKIFAQTWWLVSAENLF